ncbi:uncharacterized protein [Triticum aestivum]|uniref:uncharacterized protein n=1 Tax=Triticum aestivum TaxID=4565 RepID=UPI001D032EDC|nr:uncharacterized protein LOC123056062 [Triticum aestivum]
MSESGEVIVETFEELAIINLEEKLGPPVFHLLSSGEKPLSFRVVCVCADASRVGAAVFSSETWDWAVNPWVEIGENNSLKYKTNTMVGGSVYWPYDGEARMVKIDTTASMDITTVGLPAQAKVEWHSCKAGETKDGGICIVHASADFLLQVWTCNVDGDGIQSWIPQKRSVSPLTFPASSSLSYDPLTPRFSFPRPSPTSRTTHSIFFPPLACSSCRRPAPPLPTSSRRPKQQHHGSRCGAPLQPDLTWERPDPCVSASLRVPPWSAVFPSAGAPRPDPCVSASLRAPPWSAVFPSAGAALSRRHPMPWSPPSRTTCRGRFPASPASGPLGFFAFFQDTRCQVGDLGSDAPITRDQGDELTARAE